MKQQCILADVITAQAQKYGEREALTFVNEHGDKLQAYSYQQLSDRVTDLACALETLGLQPGDVCMIFSANRPEMLITDFACYANRAIPVSVYSTSSDDQVLYIMRDCRPKFVFVGDEKQYASAIALAAQCPWVQAVYPYYDAAKGAQNHPADYAELLAMGHAASPMCRQEVENRRLSVSPDDTATLIYTSGTTGEPKAADLPHSCFDAVVRIHAQRLTMLSDADTSLCFLPLCHIFEKAWTYFCITQGMHVAINENPKEIAKTLKAVLPTCMCSVPRFWEKAYAIINEKMAKMPFYKRWMAQAALKIGRKRNLEYVRIDQKAPWWIEFLYNRFDAMVMRPVRRIMGIDQGNIFPTAGAPISGNIVEFFRSMGVPMIIGYGLSETTATVTCFPVYGYQIGTVGTLMPELQVRIASRDDAERVSDHITGEIEVKGPTVMRCYYNNPKATEAAFSTDGWFRTGDAGYIDEYGAIVLTERLKDLFKTSNGKYIAPQAIESRLGEDRFIEQVAVVGESRKYVTAIIIPAFEALKEYARSKKIQFKTLDDLIHNSEIVKMIGDRIEQLQKGLPSFEQIKKFTLLPKAFTIESGELTNTLKIRRPVINAHYAKEIEAMYAI